MKMVFIPLPQTTNCLLPDPIKPILDVAFIEPSPRRPLWMPFETHLFLSLPDSRETNTTRRLLASPQKHLAGSCQQHRRFQRTRTNLGLERTAKKSLGLTPFFGSQQPLAR